MATPYNLGLRRRDLLSISIATGAGMMLPWPLGALPAAERVRREVHGPEARPMLELYKQAIREMQALPPWDPASWWFQANIHWIPFEGDPLGCIETTCFQDIFTAAPGTDQPTQVRIEAARRLAAGDIPIAPSIGLGIDRIWAKCPHNQLDFLPWHRLYLNFFEQVVESIVGEPFALPYWNYLDPSFRDMPEAFRPELDADGSPNPLFYGDRSPLARDPDDPSVPDSQKPLIRDQDLQWDLAAAETFFQRGEPLGLTRGFSTQVERSPHDIVHGRIGIVVFENGEAVPLGMATPAFAARDPIFWLHHANIDRLWEWWRTQPVPPGQPPRDPADVWSLEPYRFTTRDGRAIGLPAVASLGMVGTVYDYDTLEPLPPAPAPTPALAASVAADRTTLVGRSPGGVRVEDAPAAVDLEAMPSAEAALTADAAARWFVRISGVRQTGKPGGVLDLHLDAEGTSDISGPPAASFGFFNVPMEEMLGGQAHAGPGHPGREHVLEVTVRVRELVSAGADPGTLRVTVTPAGNVSPVEIERIELFSR